uniref:Uncharacterized protein n=1 Tax=viral metagenome TaxID=1070528 RepID=A0A6C0ASM9_9ZZZZ
MSDILEITELDFNDKSGWENKSSNFGGGLELLMNDKIKESGGPSSDINLDDLNNLENELNNLVDDIPSNSYKPKSDLFNKPSVSFNEEPSIKFGDSNIGQGTAQTENDSKTWDGYGKFNNIPMNPDKSIPMEPKLSKEDMLREKFKYLRKLEGLEKKGVELSKKYNMESSLQEMMGEYETIMEEKTKQNSVKFQGNMLMACINGIEFLNGRFDPFDIKLDGWSSQVEENMNDYDDVFGELYEKYKSKASMAPELKLLFQLGGSAMMIHMSNTMFKSAMPGMDDILRQNPDLMRSFQNAAVNSMSQSAPGFSGFMGNMMNPEPQVPQGRGPPPPMATQGPNAVPLPMGRAGNNSYGNRPDLNMGRSSFAEDGISLRENFERPDLQDRTTKRPVGRAEMKGPSDITDILSGLKTKTINIQEPASNPSNISNMNDSSTISISELKELQSDGNMPKRSGRRKKSASNTVSLDI